MTFFPDCKTTLNKRERKTLNPNHHQKSAPNIQKIKGSGKLQAQRWAHPRAEGQKFYVQSFGPGPTGPLQPTSVWRGGWGSSRTLSLSLPHNNRGLGFFCAIYAVVHRLGARAAATTTKITIKKKKTGVLRPESFIPGTAPRPSRGDNPVPTQGTGGTAATAGGTRPEAALPLPVPVRAPGAAITVRTRGSPPARRLLLATSAAATPRKWRSSYCSPAGNRRRFPAPPPLPGWRRHSGGGAREQAAATGRRGAAARPPWRLSEAPKGRARPCRPAVANRNQKEPEE